MSITERRAAAILNETVLSFNKLTSVAASVDEAVELIVGALRAGRKLFFCGNGGSAADAQHLTAEFLGRFLLDRAPLPAIALTTNSSAVTAIANDYGYGEIFSRQLRGLAQEGDVLIGISTSGRSDNVIAAFQIARTMNVRIISLTGETKNPMAQLADVAIQVPSGHTPRIQEMHIAVGHAICEITETILANDDK